MNFQTIISVDALAENLESPNWLILDCRGGFLYDQKKYKKYLKGHIPNAFYYCFSGSYIPDSGVTSTTPCNCASGASEIKETFQEFGFDESAQIIIYDDDDESSSSFSDSLWLLLRSIGYKNVAVLQGGITSWEKQNMPLTRQEDSSE